MLMVEGRTEGKMQTQISLFRGRNGKDEAVYLYTSAKYWLKKRVCCCQVCFQRKVRHKHLTSEGNSGLYMQNGL